MKQNTHHTAMSKMIKSIDISLRRVEIQTISLSKRYFYDLLLLSFSKIYVILCMGEKREAEANKMYICRHDDIDILSP